MACPFGLQVCCLRVLWFVPALQGLWRTCSRLCVQRLVGGLGLRGTSLGKCFEVSQTQGNKPEVVDLWRSMCLLRLSVLAMKFNDVGKRAAPQGETAP